ncbi:hypothetical protein [Teredinibacter purpureus]|uniref:hypothetical protein n=1 Tax=Teredinibacter purpureus TaxID=2731756 RepID=UPI0005F7EA4D|nr:hypothetical protein [Teredinibacter purpureus]
MAEHLYRLKTQHKWITPYEEMLTLLDKLAVPQTAFKQAESVPVIMGAKNYDTESDLTKLVDFAAFKQPNLGSSDTEF